MNLALFVSALTTELELARPRAKQLGLTAASAWNVLTVALLREVLLDLAQSRGRSAALLANGRLFSGVPGFEADELGADRAKLLAELSLSSLAPGSLAGLPIEAFGQLYESLLAARPTEDERSLRKRTGSYYTPEALTQLVVQRAFDALGAEALGRPLKILDPALGAGAFLVQAGREAAARSGRTLFEVAQHELFGVDVSPLAVAVAEASLWLLADGAESTLADAGRNLVEGDALCTPHAGRKLGRVGVDVSALSGAQGFDLVLGNPPWVAFAGRATQPLSPALRAHYRAQYRAFSGYPTLHALFIELAARHAPRGVVALLIPSPVADLDGYRHVRAALSDTHAVREPLLELGQDAFASVTQPCFALVASPRAEPAAQPERPFVLSERRRSDGAAAAVVTPAALLRLSELPRLPPELFGEMGLQTNRAVSERLLHRGTPPPADYSYALLEGRNVVEFALGQPKLFLKPDRALLDQLGCRLRDAADYRRVKLVVRQTAAIPIAAAHDGTPFRNSLLAGFELPGFPLGLTLGLLNSTLYRALHLASRRDARQGAFPQVKIAHLRSLPAPPLGAELERVTRIALQATAAGLTPPLRRELDATVYDLFGVSTAEQVEISRFVTRLSPNAGLAVRMADGDNLATPESITLGAALEPA